MRLVSTFMQKSKATWSGERSKLYSSVYELKIIESTIGVIV